MMSLVFQFLSFLLGPLVELTQRVGKWLPGARGGGNGEVGKRVQLSAIRRVSSEGLKYNVVTTVDDTAAELTFAKSIELKCPH